MTAGEIELIRIEILGDAIPAARPRFSGRRVYQPKRNTEYRQMIQASALEAMKGAAPMTGELFANVKLYRKYKRAARIYGDVDNHLKALFDGLNRIVFADDSQICRCTVEKFTDKERPRAVIEVGELDIFKNG